MAMCAAFSWPPLLDRHLDAIHIGSAPYRLSKGLAHALVDTIDTVCPHRAKRPGRDHLVVEAISGAECPHHQVVWIRRQRIIFDRDVLSKQATAVQFDMQL